DELYRVVLTHCAAHRRRRTAHTSRKRLSGWFTGHYLHTCEIFATLHQTSPLSSNLWPAQYVYTRAVTCYPVRRDTCDDVCVGSPLQLMATSDSHDIAQHS
ncbi:unnamed protein product, partial [Sphacelaria rigidula]